MSKIRYITKSGSIYIIDTDAKTWSRARGEFAADLRSTEGEYDAFYIMNNCIMLICPPFVAGSGVERLIYSTEIQKEEYLDDNTIKES